ncbi:MAG TPA: type II secretion system F family protein [Caulobacteraceae bacterium]|nr:type II secretion system F family protein [Caulobacteraceae bacterium]
MDQTMLFVLVGVLGFCLVAGVGWLFAGGSTEQQAIIKRAQTLGGGQTRDVRRPRLGQAANTAEARRRQIVNSLREQERAQKRARLALASKLHQAGIAITVQQFWMAAGVFGALVFVVAFFLHANLLVALLLGASSGVGVPLWTLSFLVARRMKQFTASFSDAMDIIVRGIKSGLPVHDCLKIIGRETPEPLAGEFRRLVENIGIGLTLDQALEKLHDSMPTSEVRFFSIVMNIQQKTGGNLAEALGNLSTVLRSRKLMREKIKALSSEATASAGIIGSLPPGVATLIWLTTPTYMAPLINDHRGWLLLGASALLMGMGVFVMTRMINFKF